MANLTVLGKPTITVLSKPKKTVLSKPKKPIKARQAYVDLFSEPRRCQVSVDTLDGRWHDCLKPATKCVPDFYKHLSPKTPDPRHCTCDEHAGWSVVGMARVIPLVSADEARAIWATTHGAKIAERKAKKALKALKP